MLQRRSLRMCLKRQSVLNKNHNNALAQFMIDEYDVLERANLGCLDNHVRDAKDI